MAQDDWQYNFKLEKQKIEESNMELIKRVEQLEVRSNYGPVLVLYSLIWSQFHVVFSDLV